MDPITTIAFDYVKGLFIERFVGSFRANVIERWTKQRAQAFFQQFCLAVANETKSESGEQLEQLLDKMFKDESCSEKLYDAYRSVCFSRSKSIGPRIIAVVTAELVLAGRQAEWEENAIFWAAENLDDGEFRGFSDYLDRMVEASKASNPRRKDVIIGECGRRLDIKITHEQIDSQWKRDDAISVGPMNLDELLGSWAEKLRSRAIMEHDVLERNWEYRDDGERYIDGDGEVREISWWLRLGPTAFRLRDLIRSLDFN